LVLFFNLLLKNVNWQLYGSDVASIFFGLSCKCNHRNVVNWSMYVDHFNVKLHLSEGLSGQRKELQKEE
jgi:hypothetical protein